ncbi:MAG: hypothetical protein QOH68_3789 [Nocardioidaceae bacterium]|nr:hypothetical protein [Nocardioidaceae bacterium]
MATAGVSAQSSLAASAPPPAVFAIRIEGFSVESNVVTTATAVTPRSGYTFAKLNSVLDLDGGRGLDMEARGANGQYAGFEGAALFSGGDVPINGNNLPGYTQAFFPSFEGFFQVSEKCATNQTEAKEAPECRDQPGPYALSRVVPDQAQPMVESAARNQGDSTNGDTLSTSHIVPNDDGTVSAIQHNEGRDQQVPGTPIKVSSFLAEVSLTASLTGSTGKALCTGEVKVGEQVIDNNKELQQALAPLTIGSNLHVTFEPPTAPVVTALPGGGVQASCRGPRFEVMGVVQGGSGVVYTYGNTVGTSGITENPIFGGDDAAGAPDLGGIIPPPATGSSTSGFTGTSATPTLTPAAEQPATANPPSAPASDEAAGPDLIRKKIDAMPVGLMTGAAATLLPLVIWLLLGVTGSLARGSTRLLLPPFRDEMA